MEDETRSSRPVGRSGQVLTLIAAFMVALLLIAAGVAALPIAKAWLGIRLDVATREWIEWLGLVSELLLFALFGEALFARPLAAAARRACAALEADATMTVDLERTRLASVVADIVRLADTSRLHTRWSDGGRALRGVWQLYRHAVSYPLLARLSVFVVSRAIPGGLYATVALCLAAAHFGCEIVLLQDLRVAN